jgi:hypothetical protein
MGKYARGKHAVLIDDRSGFKIRYKDARTEWTGFRVYKGDWEPKQPQLDPEMYIQGGDPSVLYKPRPPQSTSDTIVSLGPLHGKFSGQCAANLGRVAIGAGEDAQGFQASGVLNSTGIAIAVVLPIPTEAWQQATSALGSVTIAAAEDAEGFEATASLGTVVEALIQPVSLSSATATLGSVVLATVEDAEGFAGTSTLGSVTLNVSETVSGIELGTMTASLGNTGLFFNTTEIPPGLASTSTLGTLILNGAHPVAMSQMTSTLGSVTPEVITAVPVTMSGMTATLGTVAAVTPGWGTYLWGTDEWGN